MVDERKVVESLVGERYRALFQSNPWFRCGIETLAEMTQFFVEGLAASARRSDAGRQLLQKSIERYNTPEGQADIHRECPPDVVTEGKRHG
jgi:uncharacterized protein YjaZ